MFFKNRSYKENKVFTASYIAEVLVRPFSPCSKQALVETGSGIELFQLQTKMRSGPELTNE